MASKLDTKQKEVKDLLSTVDDSAFVLFYFDKAQLLRNRFPEIKSFEDYLSVFKSRLGDKRKDVMRDLQQKESIKRSMTNKDGFVMNFKVPDVLGVEQDVYQKIYKKGEFIAPAGMESFKKWGKYLETPYFNYDEILKFKEEKLPTVLENLGFNKKEQEKEIFIKICEDLNKKFVGSAKLFTKDNTNTKDPFNAIDVRHSFNLNGVQIVFSSVVDSPIRLRSYKSKSNSQLEKFVENVVVATQKTLVNFENKIKEDLKVDLYSLDNFLKKMGFNKENSSGDTNNNLDASNDVFVKDYNDLIRDYDALAKVAILQREGSRLEKVFDLKNYQNTFPIAREMVRNVHIVCGPTNSGKTYEAIEALKNANSGVYLAPLRLMAMEIFDKLNAMGIPCSLKTGDSEIIVPGAKHIASTIECLDLSQFYDVAVIDEFQMLADEQRGWAWTQAMLGVCANVVYLIGSSAAVEIAKYALSKTNDVVTVKEVTRHSQLEIIPKPLDIKNIQAGDAVIVFSRNGVIEWAEELKKRGKSVSLIYGALAPEVRRKQAEMFLNGDTDILVSTDAIGMGLNLPIKRVLFTTMEKYNGVCMSRLTPTEIKQIAGRAGRYKEDGYVGVIDGNHTVGARYDYYGDLMIEEDKSYEYIRALRRGLTKENEPVTCLWIAPNSFHLNELSKALDTNSILRVLEGFNYTVSNELFIPSFFENADTIVEACGDRFFDLDLQTQYNLINTPIDLRSGVLERVARVIRSTFFHKNKSVLLDWVNENCRGIENIEVELKMLTALVHIAKQTNLIDMSGVEDVREFLSKSVIDILVHVFRQSPERKREYSEEKARKAARKAERVRVKKEELKELQLRFQKLMPEENATEERKAELKRARKKLGKKISSLQQSLHFA